MINLLGIFIRSFGISFLSEDMNGCLIPWYNSMKIGGVTALKEQIGDYNTLYQTIIALMTYFNIDCIVLYKVLSILFDYIMAISIALFVSKVTKNKVLGIQFNIIYGAVLLLPTVVLNSSYWGQCDSIYSTFLVLTLFFMYDKKYAYAFVMLGLGFAFKLQMIFILPFNVCYYLCSRKFSMIYIGISIITFWFSGIIAFINGRNLLAPFIIYSKQTTSYESMYLNFPNFWVLLGDDYNDLKRFAIIFTVALLGMGLYIILSKKIEMDSCEVYVSIAVGSIWTCLMFLPAIHEGYSYPLDVLLLILGCLNRKYLKFAIISIMLSIITYGHYLFATEGSLQYYAVVYVLMYMKYIGMLLNNDTKAQEGEI